VVKTKDSSGQTKGFEWSNQRIRVVKPKGSSGQIKGFEWSNQRVRKNKDQQKPEMPDLWGNEPLEYNELLDY
jgi:hypothetical protein